ncbi:MAG: T9SS type A sorting domain-containing protein [Saprospiraceae bacterium]
MHNKVILFISFFSIVYIGFKGEIYSQSKNEFISICGRITNSSSEFDKVGNTYCLMEFSYPDSVWLNNEYSFDLLSKQGNRIDLKSLILFKVDQKSNKSTNLHIYGVITSGGAVKVDNSGNIFIAFNSFSDTIRIEDSIYINSEYKGGFIMLKLDNKFAISKIFVIPNFFAGKIKMEISQNSIILSDDYAGYPKIINYNLSCYPPSPHHHNSFICSLKKDLDSVNYLVNFDGFGENDIYGFAVDSDQNIFFSGTSTAKTLQINGENFNFPNSKYGAWFFIGKINNLGQLEWLSRTGCSAGDALNSITLTDHKSLLITGTFFTTKLFFDNNTIENPNYPRPSSFLLELNKDGELLKIKSYSKNGSLLLRGIQTNENQKNFAIFTAIDTLFDESGKSYYNKPYRNFVCELNDNWDIVTANYFNSNDDGDILTFTKNPNGRLFYSLLYFGDSLFHNGTLSFDINEHNYLRIKYLLISVDVLSSNSKAYNKPSEIKIYPNPSFGELNIVLPKDLISKEIGFKIYNIEGVEISVKTEIFNSEFKIVGLPKGVYYIKVFFKNSIALTNKFIVLD